MRILTLLMVSLLLITCSFNGQYLVPSKIPEGVKKAQLIDYRSKDTIAINIGENYQPTFADKNGDTVDFGYQIESVLFDNSNGNKLNGWIISPNEGYNGKTILFLHGNAGNITSHYPVVIPLVMKGFRVFLFDYSGFGFSQGKATRDNVLTDADAALHYILKRTDAEKGNLIIYGQSLGGHLAVVLASRNEKVIDGLVIEGAFSSHKDIAAETAGIFGRILVAEKYSALESIMEYQKPILIIHSKEDHTIPIKQARKLFQNANEPKTFYEIEKCHMCGPLFYTDSIALKINEMIGKPGPDEKK